MSNKEQHEAYEPEPNGLAKKLFFYTVAGVILWGIAVFIFVMR